jgi:hypothetical protein
VFQDPCGFTEFKIYLWGMSFLDVLVDVWINKLLSKLFVSAPVRYS